MRKPLPSFSKKPAAAKSPPAPLVVVPTKLKPRARRGHIQLTSGLERGRLNLLVSPELRKQLLKLAVERDVKIGALAEELISEALLARKAS